MSPNDGKGARVNFPFDCGGHVNIEVVSMTEHRATGRFFLVYCNHPNIAAGIFTWRSLKLDSLNE